MLVPLVKMIKLYMKLKNSSKKPSKKLPVNIFQQTESQKPIMLNPTQLTKIDLWKKPKQAASFLAAC